MVFVHDTGRNLAANQVMTVEVTVAGHTRRITLATGFGSHSFYGYMLVGNFIVRLSVFPPMGSNPLSLFEIDISTIDEFSDNSAAEQGELAAWEKGSETEVLITAPAIATFPGQAKVEEVTFPVRLKLVTLPHKSRAKK